MDTKLAPVSGLWQSAVADVVFEIKLFVVDPVRKVEFERDTNQSSFEQRAHVQTSLDMREDILEPDDLAARYR
jgi:hypothetical protein